MDAKKLQDLGYFLDEIQKYNHELEVLALDKEKADATSEFKYKGFEISIQNKIEIDREIAVNQLKQIFASYNLGLLSRYPITYPSDEPKFLAMIDILGFSKIVSIQEEKKLEQIFENLIIKSTQMALSGRKNRINADGSATPDLQAAKVNHLIFSDTLLFWTNDGSPNSLIDLIEVIYTLFWLNISYFSIPLRGAITYGSLNFKDPLFVLPNIKVSQSALFGKAIIEAYLLEKAQQWLGCMLSKGSIDAFYKANPTPEQIEKLKKNIVNYQVPFKGNRFMLTVQKVKACFVRYYMEKESNFFVINWAKTTSLQKAEEAVHQCFTYHTKDSKLKGEALTKYKNTIKFANTILSKEE